jgi:hypothetical protein
MWMRWPLSPHFPRQLHHREFGFGQAGKRRRRQLEDPGTADAVGGNRQAPAGLTDRGELQLHAGQGEAQRRVVAVATVGSIVRVVAVIAGPHLFAGG